MKRSIVFGSVKPATIWPLSKCLFLIPVWLPETRLTARRRSRWLRKWALDGESAMNIQITMAQRQVAPPSYLWLFFFHFGGYSR